MLDNPKVSLVSKDSSMLDGLEDASIEMEESKVWNSCYRRYIKGNQYNQLNRQSGVMKIYYGSLFSSNTSGKDTRNHFWEKR